MEALSQVTIEDVGIAEHDMTVQTKKAKLFWTYKYIIIMKMNFCQRAINVRAGAIQEQWKSTKKD